jgi:D-proline reductase (dithiol) PrdB
MSNDDIKRVVADIALPTFETQSFVTPKPLKDCTVAIVTTAGLRHNDQDLWAARDTSYRVLYGDRRDIRMDHWSPNFDRVGFAADINVVFPIDRLRDLANQGVIGKVAPRHVSFTGNQDETMASLRIDTGPSAAQLLREDGVDVILLTPV